MSNYLNITTYIVPFLLAFGLVILLTLLIKKLALKWQIVDRPGVSPERKIQKASVPLLGGLAIFLSFSLVMLGYTLFSDRVLGGYMLPKYLIGITIGGLLLMIGGFLDDKYNLKPRRQIIWPILACLVIIASGIGITYITNPFGGTVYLDNIKIKLFTLDGLPYYFTLFADVFGFIWLLSMMYTTKLLDGLDGLVSGMTTIGAIVIFFLSLNKEVAQPETALLAIILAGASLGFLLFNFHPARIFLGEGGSLWTGFMLGVLSIISGAKIATTLLIMGIAILDVIWVIIRRLFFEKKSPFGTADRKHLHFRLLDVGLSHRQAVLFLWFFSLCFGLTALFFKGQQKLITLIVLATVMLILALILAVAYNKRKRAVKTALSGKSRTFQLGFRPRRKDLDTPSSLQQAMRSSGKVRDKYDQR